MMAYWEASSVNCRFNWDGKSRTANKVPGSASGGHGPRMPGDSSVEIRLRNGRSLMVRPGFDAEHVRALLVVVEAAE